MRGKSTHLIVAATFQSIISGGTCDCGRGYKGVVRVRSSVHHVPRILSNRVLKGKIRRIYSPSIRELAVNPSPIPRVFRLRVIPLIVPAAIAAFWERKYAANTGP
jgi:hypothetical protein